MSNEDLNETEAKFVSYVSAALDAVRMSENPEELNRYRKLFKKCVPLTMRSYVAAYLAKEQVGGLKGTSSKTQPFTKEAKTNFHNSKPKIVLDEKDAKVLFFSVGRRRGVNPKDIITLIMQNVEIPREHIGEIKILENYCFVQIMAESADSVVESLNNFRYRGRMLSVSYSTKLDKDEKSQSIGDSSLEKKDVQEMGDEKIENV